MSNRPNARPSRSVQLTANVRASRAEAARHRRLALGLGFGGAAVLVLVVAVLVAVATRPAAPELDARAAHGADVARAKGCTSCHTSSGDRGEGPTWKAIYGKPVPLADGATVIADEEYLARAIREPRAQQVAGFGAMPTVALSDDEVDAVIAYIRALA